MKVTSGKCQVTSSLFRIPALKERAAYLIRNLSGTTDLFRLIVEAAFFINYELRISGASHNNKYCI